MKARSALWILLLFLFLPFSNAAGYTVDGGVSDWGINLNLAGVDGYLNSVSPVSSTADYITEDFFLANGYVGPGYGGQTFDIEAMYFDNDSTYGYLAIITGLPISGSQGFEPGDIGIDVTGVSALLVDGSSATTPYEYGISLSDSKLHKVNTWLGVYYDGTPAPDFGYYSDPWVIKQTTGDAMYANFAYSGATPINSHYVYEFSFLLSDLGLQNGGEVNFHWTMECGNDNLNLSATVNPVPEPATMFLLGIGLMGIGAFGRKKLDKCR